MTADNANQAEQEFAIQRIYLKDLSFESPQAPNVFLEEWKPELSMDLNTATNSLGDDNHEVVLTVSVTVKMADKTVFVVEVKQAGIFTVKGFEQKEELPAMLGSFCPNVLYPYARQIITYAVMEGGFPQLYIAPVNFDAMYQQHQMQQAANGTGGDTIQ
jgi:preprotein translocase subunit SecB